MNAFAFEYVLALQQHGRAIPTKEENENEHAYTYRLMIEAERFGLDAESLGVNRTGGVSFYEW